MKRQMNFLFVTVMLFLACSYTNAQLQLGGGLGYGTQIESVGITVKGNYPFNEQWEGSGSFGYFFPNTGTEFLELRYWELNADGHYIVKSTEKYTFYPLAGLNIAGISWDYENLPSTPFIPTDNSDTEIGLNIGVGGTLIFSESLSGYAEIKYTLSGYDQLIANVGVLFRLGGS